jgi:hypothetical protein
LIPDAGWQSGGSINHNDAILNDVRKDLPTPDDSMTREFAHAVTGFFADAGLTIR